jgi:hypothetical protein
MKGVRIAVLYFCSPFARIANKINWRIGRPYRSNFEADKLAEIILIPGMIILSHKDFELTNWFISGYWTHVAVVSTDGRVVQAVSKGVIKTGINEFFSSIDDFILMEPAFCCPNSMFRAAENMEKFLDYPYNFTFLSNGRSFTCIDLVCRAYAIDIRKIKRHSPGRNSFLGYFTREVMMPEYLLSIEKGWNIVHSTISDGKRAV